MPLVSLIPTWHHMCNWLYSLSYSLPPLELYSFLSKEQQEDTEGRDACLRFEILTLIAELAEWSGSRSEGSGSPAGRHGGAGARRMMVAVETRGGNIRRPVKITMFLKKAETSGWPLKHCRVRAKDFLFNIAKPPVEHPRCSFTSHPGEGRVSWDSISGAQWVREGVCSWVFRPWQGREQPPYGVLFPPCKAAEQTWSGFRVPTFPGSLFPTRPAQHMPQTSCFCSPTLLSPTASQPALRKVSDKQILTKT